MDDVDESRKEEDRAFILRLPPEQAREVRQRLAENNFQDIRLHIDPATDRHKTPGGFKGRTGTFSMAAAAASGAHVRLPLTVMDLPTMLECYRTIDGKAGEYVKTADVSQILVVHNEEEEAQALRARRLTGRHDSGITAATHKITREFLRRKPHFTALLRQRKFNIKSTFHAIQRAERHILRVQKGGGDKVSDTEIEEIEVEVERVSDDKHERLEGEHESGNVDVGTGGGKPYHALDGDLYYHKNGRAYRHDTNERVGFLATKVRFKLSKDGVYCTMAECEVPTKLRVQDDQRPVDDLDAERIKYEAQYDAELDVDMQQQSSYAQDATADDDMDDAAEALEAQLENEEDATAEREGEAGGVALADVDAGYGELYRHSLVRTEDAEEEVAEEEIEVMPAGEGDEDAGGVGGVTGPADGAPLLVMQDGGAQEDETVWTHADGADDMGIGMGMGIGTQGEGILQGEDLQLGTHLHEVQHDESRQQLQQQQCPAGAASVEERRHGGGEERRRVVQDELRVGDSTAAARAAVSDDLQDLSSGVAGMEEEGGGGGVVAGDLSGGDANSHFQGEEGVDGAGATAEEEQGGEVMDAHTRAQLQSIVCSCQAKLKEIDEQQSKLNEQVTRAPNPVLRQRLQKQADAYSEVHGAEKEQLESELQAALSRLSAA